jgi:hypothetical protein
MKIISASRANELTGDVVVTKQQEIENSPEFQSVIQDIMRKINGAIKQGKYDVTISRLHKKNKYYRYIERVLEDAGYRVTNSSASGIRINW